jgi:hypothetical protein
VNKRDVIKTIQEAFSEVPMPPVPNLVKHWGEEILTDEWSQWPDGPAVGRVLANKRWQDVDYKRLAMLGAPLSLMTPEAVQYYLPTLLIYTLKYPEVMNADSLKLELSPPPFGFASSIEEFENRFRLLTPSQRAAVSNFFDYVKNRPEFNEFPGDVPFDQVSTYWLQDIRI